MAFFIYLLFVCLCVVGLGPFTHCCWCADNIESNVETTAVRVEAGNRQLESAVRAKVMLMAAVTYL